MNHSQYEALDSFFYEPSKAARFPRLEMFYFNEPLLHGLNLEDPKDVPAYLYRQLHSSESLLSLAYSGHQFGHFTMLGDGRAALLGSLKAALDASTLQSEAGEEQVLLDLHAKGSGPTPFSRRGDGRAALGPMLREVIISEFMRCTNVPTTGGLAVFLTGEDVMRQKPAPGGVLVRTARSHVRVGTFEYARYFGDRDKVRSLLSHCVKHYEPSLWDEFAGSPQTGQRSPDDFSLGEWQEVARGFFRSVCKKQATLVAQWMNLGFVHGVMNTDNVSVVGETIDYGPCAFIDDFNPKAVFSSIDRGGRYAYGRQPEIMIWNLARLADALGELLGETESQIEVFVNEVLKETYARCVKDHQRFACERLMVMDETRHDELAKSFFTFLSDARVDYHFSFFHLWSNLGLSLGAVQEPIYHSRRRGTEGLEESRFYRDFFERWKSCFSGASEWSSKSESFYLNNPIRIPRNDLVEGVLESCERTLDVQAMKSLLKDLRQPFVKTMDELPDLGFRRDEDYKNFKTFCGT